jgi:nanoRNase/pAp phosphatase (c-di-AMP/oligoRNAs hydrolase)
VSNTNEAGRRLITRADFDGLVCAALLKELDLIDEIVFVHPKDVADGQIEITDRDITTNVPFDARCFLAFDHHASEAIRHRGNITDNLVLDPEADSAARVVYRYYGGRERFPNISPQLMAAVDKADAARFTEEEILNPSGWVLLNFIMDPRTGLGRFPDFRISNFDLMMQLIDYCRDHQVDEILSLPDVEERIRLYFNHSEKAVEQIRRCAKIHDNVLVLDLRDERTIYTCNRFMVYALYPKCNCSIHVIWGRAGLNTVFAIGNSIFNRSQPVNIGELCLKYGGGGHADAGTVQAEHSDAERVQRELINALAVSDEPVALDEAESEPESDDLDDDMITLNDDHDPAEGLLEEVIKETGMALLASKQDIREIHDRLDRIEQMITQMTVTSAH